MTENFAEFIFLIKILIVNHYNFGPTKFLILFNNYFIIIFFDTSFTFI